MPYARLFAAASRISRRAICLLYTSWRRPKKSASIWISIRSLSMLRRWFWIRCKRPLQKKADRKRAVYIAGAEWRVATKWLRVRKMRWNRCIEFLSMLGARTHIEMNDCCEWIEAWSTYNGVRTALQLCIFRSLQPRMGENWRTGSKEPVGQPEKKCYGFIVSIIQLEGKR